MRLIDADALKESMSKRVAEKRDLNASFYEVINEQPTMDAEPKWIPTSERLPEIGDYVLLCFREGRDCPYNRIAVGKLGSHEVVDKDFTIIGAKTVWYTDRWYCDFDSVIAWIPLPELYKGE